MNSPPSLDDVVAAAARIAPHVHRTPVATSETFDRELSAELFFKCENLQKVGAFKARGAVNAVMRLDDAVARRGVVTHSSGNHGAALAYAARARGIPCTVVMPEDAPRIKLDAVRGYSAEVLLCPRAERASTCDRVVAERGCALIHPYENPDVVAGQGTAALELLDQVRDLDLIVAPVGGGGLISGTTIATKGQAPGTAVWGAEPEAVDDAYRSLETGDLQPAVENPDSICDGLLTGLGRLAFQVLREHGVRIVTVSEQEVAVATRSILERMKLVVEPSAAIVLAALRKQGPQVRGRRVGAILSGGNTDFAWLDATPGPGCT